MPSSRPSFDLEVLRDVTVDDAIVSYLPPKRLKVITSSHGESSWSCPLKVVVTRDDGEVVRYFLKMTRGDLGRGIVNGEYESMSIYFALCPEFVVKPLGWGSCSSTPDIHFMISEFHDFIEERPKIDEFCANVANMHSKSMQLRDELCDMPNVRGRFGFHTTTHLGMLPYDNRWCGTWEEFYTQQIKGILAFEEKTQGPSDELDYLARRLIEQVIPRLLRPLESDGRSIRPALVHGDLQGRNVLKDAMTNKLMMFDAGTFWAHNECEIGKWRPLRWHLGPEYMEEYHKHIPKSPPQEDWEDRIILYTIRCDLLSSAHYIGDDSLRKLALKDMTYLVNKYARRSREP